MGRWLRRVGAMRVTLVLTAVAIVGVAGALWYWRGFPPIDAMALSALIVTPLSALMLATIIANRIADWITWRFAKIGGRGRRAIPKGLMRNVDRRFHALLKRKAGYLARERRIMRSRGVSATKWRAFQDEFIAERVFSHLRESTAQFLARREKLMSVWRGDIDAACDAIDGERAGRRFIPGMDGAEYEMFCVERLERHGWTASRASYSADQGLDVTARKGDVTLAIQCKRYAHSVGNAAVQQIVAAKALVGDDVEAAVISNARYTKAAIELAAANGVYLLHHEQIPHLDAIVARGGPEIERAAA